MRPLYLEHVGTVVQLDGPALRVKCSGSSDRWFPLQRVSQVVSAGRVEWATPALLACAEQGITVSFTDDSGAVIARIVGRPGERLELRQKLADFLDRADWQTLYRQWLRAMEQMAVRSVLRRSGVSWAEPPTPKALRQMFQCEVAAMGMLEACERIGAEVHGLLVGLGTQALRDSGVTGEFEQQFSPAADLAAVVFWDFQLLRLAWLEDRLKTERIEAPSRQDVVAFFELRRTRTERLIQGLINRLHRWLIELNQWPRTTPNVG